MLGRISNDRIILENERGLQNQLKKCYIEQKKRKMSTKLVQINNNI